jgi:hypothetical protein
MYNWVVLSLDYKKQKFGVGRKPKGNILRRFET